MNKLGYKQKGIPMLKSPVKAINPNLGNIGKVGFDKYGTKLKNPERALSSEPAPVSDFDKYGVQTMASRRSKGPRIKDKNIPNPTATEMVFNPMQVYRGPTQEESKKLTQALAPIVKDPIKGSGESTRKKVNLPKNTNATQTNTKKINEGPGVDKTGKNTYRGTKYLEDGSIDSAYKNKSKKIVSKGTKYLEDGSVDSAYKKSSNKKPAAKSMSREEIKNQKDASKKEGKMSRKEIRLQKLNSKAASTKRSTNKTIKSIDTSTGTTVKSAKSREKQSSAKSSRAISIDKKARLEKKAGKLKSRIEIQKNNRAKRKANKKIRANR